MNSLKVYILFFFILERVFNVRIKAVGKKSSWWDYDNVLFLFRNSFEKLISIFISIITPFTPTFTSLDPQLCHSEKHIGPISNMVQEVK
jgi:hypothetical protein